MISKLFFFALFASLAVAEIPWIGRAKRDVGNMGDATAAAALAGFKMAQPMQCPASQVELSEWEWNM